MDAPPPDPAEARRRSYLRGWLLIGAVLWLASLVLVGWLVARLSEPAPGAGPTRRAVAARAEAQAEELRELRQQVATLRRSDQISRNANIELQSTLAEREEEVSGLRADVDFYERLVGSTGQRQGLRVHEARFTPESAGTWRYTVTLTQNLNRGAISRGQMRLSVEGVRAGKLVTVRWDELRQGASTAGQPFSFRYFQELEDSVLLPPGFTPQRVRVSLSGAGSPVEQSFPWRAEKPAAP